MKTIEFFVSGTPKPQPRPRATGRGGFVRMYDPGTADEWKDAIKSEFTRHGYDQTMCAGPVSLYLRFLFQLPKSKQSGTPHISRPDLDNLQKAVMDAMVDIGFMKDDSQVDDLRVTKAYGFVPGCEIVITY